MSGAADQAGIPRSRARGRLYVLARALPRVAGGALRRRPEAAPRRILVAHHLLLGDTLMLTPLLAKLAALHPAAERVMALPAGYASLYAGTPYGIRAVGWTPAAPWISGLFERPGFDLAVVPGDNRHAWLAAALGARWIVAYAGDRPAYKSWAADELPAYPGSAAAWGDMVAALVPGPPPPPYDPAQWPAPPARAFEQPRASYAVLHVGASTPLKHWESARWGALARWLRERGLEVVWSAGRGEEAIVARCDPEGHFLSCAGRLDLCQLWNLVARARLLVAPDTGVAHLGRLTGTPTVALFGPGSAVLCGAGEFWRDSPYRAVTVDGFPCRDQTKLFRRDIAWVRRCGRSTRECAHPRCMDAIAPAQVHSAIAELGALP